MGVSIFLCIQKVTQNKILKHFSSIRDKSNSSLLISYWLTNIDILSPLPRRASFFLLKNCLCGMIAPSLVTLVMTPNMMFWHIKLMPRLCPYSGVCTQQNVHTSAGGCCQCGFVRWRYLLCYISPRPLHNISLQWNPSRDMPHNNIVCPLCLLSAQ